MFAQGSSRPQFSDIRPCDKILTQQGRRDLRWPKTGMPPLRPRQGAHLQQHTDLTKNCALNPPRHGSAASPARAVSWGHGTPHPGHGVRAVWGLLHCPFRHLGPSLWAMPKLSARSPPAPPARLRTSPRSADTRGTRRGSSACCASRDRAPRASAAGGVRVGPRAVVGGLSGRCV